jgi:hypothetical protein
VEFFWDEAKSFPGRSWGLLGGMLLVGILIASNIYFYRTGEGWMALDLSKNWLNKLKVAN